MPDGKIIVIDSCVSPLHNLNEPFSFDRSKAKRSMINEVRLRWYDEVSVDTKSYQQALDAEIKILKDRRRALFAEETRSREGLLRWQQQQPFPPQATGFNFTQSCNDYYGIASDYQGQM